MARVAGELALSGKRPLQAVERAVKGSGKLAHPVVDVQVEAMTETALIDLRGGAGDRLNRAHRSAGEPVTAPQAIQRQGYVLAIQDAFWLVLAIMLVSLVTAGFVRMGRPALAGAPSTAGVERRESIVLE